MYSADYVHNILDELSHVREQYRQTAAKVENVKSYCQYAVRPDARTIYSMLSDNEEKRP